MACEVFAGTLSAEDSAVAARLVLVAATAKRTSAPELTDWLAGCLVKVGWLKPVATAASSRVRVREGCIVFIVCIAFIFYGLLNVCIAFHSSMRIRRTKSARN